MINTHTAVFAEPKHYNGMNRRERRKYLRLLQKAQMWDGAEVIDRLTKKNRLTVEQ